MSNVKDNDKKNILVLGGTGKTGSRIVQRLKAMDLQAIAGSRNGYPRFDWEDITTWVPVLKNIHAVYISFQPDLAMPGAVETIREFTKMAVQCGVTKLVLLSGRGEPDALQCEEIVITSGVAWTVIRASWFNQNFSEGNFLQPVASGCVALPAGNIAEPFVDVNDIADVAVAALTDDVHNGEIYEVTGPRLLTFKEAVEEIANATGKQIKYEQLTISTYTSILKEYEVPAEHISLITYLFTKVLDGRNETVNDGIQRALGRKPKDFSDYVKEVAATGVWN